MTIHPHGKPHSSHWGQFFGRWEADGLKVTPHPDDPQPSQLLNNIPAGLRNRARPERPLVRRGWLERGPGPDQARGHEPFASVPWDEALDMAAAELKRVTSRYTPEAVFGGSYGWSSAGRFHHGQSQIHRFLNSCLGGYTKHVNTYSSGAAAVILPHVIGDAEEVTRKNVGWREIIEEAELVVAFGGIPARTKIVSGGGNSHHVTQPNLLKATQRGVKFVSVSPIKDDIEEPVVFEWVTIRPATDTALMLALAHVLVTEGLHNKDFLARYCVGYDEFERYLLGKTDGRAKNPHWASAICGVSEWHITDLARRMARSRTLITTTFSLQRAEYGEQPVWMAITLAAILGQIGQPGAGFTFGHGSIGNYGKPALAVPVPTLPQGVNPIKTYIPCARISDMLLGPGETYNFNGSKLTYPDIRLVYWAGGNPFHHHHDLQRLEQAFTRPDTVIIHDPQLTASARFADFFFPCTMTVEREDIGASANDSKLVAMHRLAEPFGEVRDDFAIFSALASRLGKLEDFTEGMSSREWIADLYERTRKALAKRGDPAPDFEEFWERGELTLPTVEPVSVLRRFRRDPDANPLPTPSGKIEITSERIRSFGYATCPPHPTWMPGEEWLGAPRASQFPIQLVANQPATRLHSQLDFGDYSRSSKIAGREPIRMHWADAEARGIKDGDIVRVFNDRGSCLAGVKICTDLSPRVAQLSTGAWYDPQVIQGIGKVCAHGNPNVLTKDIGTSELAQGSSGQLALVEIEKLTAEAPPVRAFEPVATVPLSDGLEARIKQLGKAE